MIEWQGRLAATAEALGAEIGEAETGAGPAGTAAFDAAVLAETHRRLSRLADGIEAYRRHPYRRDVTEPPVVWQDGAARLLDYGDGKTGAAVLVVPSLINRAYILDLSSRCSLLRWLAASGVRPLLLDWGAPGAAERALDLSGYIEQRAMPALARAVEVAGGPVGVAGYCMGGLLAVALAARQPASVARLALLATPWDFHCDAPARRQATRLQGAMAPWWPIIEALGEVPVDVIQALFSVGDPLQVPRKFLRFAEMTEQSEAAEDFVALEDWLNDGVPLAGKVARDCMSGWYGDNAPAAGAWRVGGAVIAAREIAAQAFVLVPQKDRIVPPSSAAALADELSQAEVASVPLGHIGMVVGRRAQAKVWEPLRDWLTKT